MIGDDEDSSVDQAVEALPKDFWIGEFLEERLEVPGTYQSWASSLGHEVDERRICRTCGRGGTCVFHSFHDALLVSVVRELNRLGRLTAPPEDDEDRDLNDPFGLWGKAPSYRCYVSRHTACEPDGAERGCTCSCGHQEPVCACGAEKESLEGPSVECRVECPKWEYR